MTLFLQNLFFLEAELVGLCLNGELDQCQEEMGFRNDTLVGRKEDSGVAFGEQGFILSKGGLLLRQRFPTYLGRH